MNDPPERQEYSLSGNRTGVPIDYCLHKGEAAQERSPLDYGT